MLSLQEDSNAMTKILMNFRIEEELKEEFEKYANTEFKDMSEVIRDLMYNWVLKKRKQYQSTK